MAVNFPLSLDSLSNPSSGDKLDNPSHSTQHGDANDILEALETKLGIGASPAGSATAGFPLVHSSGGTTAWAQVGYEGITSGTATSGQVLTAGTATGSSIWTTQGLTQIVPTSVAVGAGSGSVDANGAVTFTAASSVAVIGCFSSTYDNYRLVIQYKQLTGNNLSNFRLRAASTDISTNYYYGNSGYSSAGASIAYGAANDSRIYCQDNGQFVKPDSGPNGLVIDFYKPNSTERKNCSYQHSYWRANDTFGIVNGGGFTSSSTIADSFTFNPDATGTITGTIRVYGYKN